MEESIKYKLSLSPQEREYALRLRLGSIVCMARNYKDKDEGFMKAALKEIERLAEELPA